MQEAGSPGSVAYDRHREFDGQLEKIVEENLGETN